MLKGLTVRDIRQCNPKWDCTVLVLYWWYYQRLQLTGLCSKRLVLCVVRYIKTLLSWSTRVVKPWDKDYELWCLNNLVHWRKQRIEDMQIPRGGNWSHMGHTLLSCVLAISVIPIPSSGSMHCQHGEFPKSASPVVHLANYQASVWVDGITMHRPRPRCEFLHNIVGYLDIFIFTPTNTKMHREWI